MTWWAVDVRAAGETRDAVAAWLVTDTGQAVEERGDGVLVGFAPSEDQARSLAERVRSGFAPPPDVSIRAVEPVDWSIRWREGLGPRTIGRLTLVPSWVPVPAGVGAVVSVDPETAFGSGEHGSTRAVLALLERHLMPGARVLDLGTGSGILAIAAVKLGARHVFAVEIDAEALPVAAANARRNGVAASIELLEGDAALLTPLCAPVELVLSNILREPNLALLPVIHDALVPGGIAIFSGMEAGEAGLFRPALSARGLEIVEETVDDGWWAVAAARP